MTLLGRGKDKAVTSASVAATPKIPSPPVVQSPTAVTEIGATKSRPILEEMRRIRRAKQEELEKTRKILNALIADIGSLEKELSMCRFDEQYVEDHPQIEDIFTPTFLIHFTERQLRREEVIHGQVQKDQEGQQNGQTGSDR